MSVLYSGGRSGIVAIRLYLAFIWKASAPPYTTTAPARAWATLLNLDEPETLGQRRVTRAIRALETQRLIEVDRSPGKVPTIRILNESGNGQPYEPPSGSFYDQDEPDDESNDQDATDSNIYFKVPISLWLEGQFQTLSGPGVVLLLILLAEQGGRGKPVWFAGDVFNNRYQVSHKTRTVGVQELQNMGLLQVSRQAVAGKGVASVFTPIRKRHVYRLQNNALLAKRKKLVRTVSKKAVTSKLPTGNVASAQRPAAVPKRKKLVKS